MLRDGYKASAQAAYAALRSPDIKVLFLIIAYQALQDRNWTLFWNYVNDPSYQRRVDIIGAGIARAVFRAEAFPRRRCPCNVASGNGPIGMKCTTISLWSLQHQSPKPNGMHRRHTQGCTHTTRSPGGAEENERGVGVKAYMDARSSAHDRVRQGWCT
jgi:hypothetical protein